MLRAEPFMDNLCKKLVANSDELRTQATKFMQMDEVKEFRNTTQIETNDKRSLERDITLWKK